ncbi:MAG: GNAT family N-acetyltransferase [Rhodospirillaceae bacterium]
MGAFRKLLPNELSRYRDHLLRLDRADRHLRFAGTVSDAVIEQHCLRLDRRNTLVIGYFDGGELRGAVEMRAENRPTPRRTELAFSIERPWQHRGIGTALMRRALTVASNRGIRTVDIMCLLENRAMRALARKFSNVVTIECGEVGVTITLELSSGLSFMVEAFEDSTGLVASMLESLKLAVGASAH